MSADLTQEIIKKESQYVLQTYPRLPFVMEKGKGAYVYDLEGKEYLDFGSGIAVTALGHSNGMIINAVYEQIKQLSHVSNLYHTEPHTELAEQICMNSFGDKVFYSNSGTEAVEASLKFARKYSKTKFVENKTKFVAFSNSFHGRTFGALSVTDRMKYQEPFKPLVPEVEVLPYNNIDALQEGIDNQTCAVIVEVVQGEGGINLATKEFMKELKTACQDNQALLIIDEIQTGFGRTGKLWAYQHYDIEPDMMSLAKAMGGGLPIGATVLSDEIAETISPGDHGSTFGGGPVAASCGLVVIEQINKPGFLKQVNEISEYLVEKLKGINHKSIKEIRSMGLMIGVEINGDAGKLYAKAHEYGVLILTAGANVIRLLPPLIITKIDVDKFINAFSKMLKEIEV
ncbi:MAG: aspartate aminotransferase family protein [Anaerolineaceae bacterium]|nr:aspartate aminotransferase family protein [Anaerolineaceae bacterium]